MSRSPLQCCVNFPAATAFADDLLEVRIAGLAHFHAQSIVSKNLQFLDVVVGFSRHHRMHAAGVVSDHAAQRASIMGRGVGSECQVMLFSSVTQAIEDNPRLNSCDPPRRIDLDDLGHVFREIEHHGDVAALSSQRSSTAPAKDGRTVFTSQRDGCNDIVRIARENDSDGNLAIVGSVGGIERACAVVETNVTTDVASEGGGERALHPRPPI